MNPVTTSVVIAALSLSVFTSEASADRKMNLAESPEVKSCVSAVTSQLDTSNARKVRHVITNFEPEMIGYGVTMETSLYRGDEQVDYSAYCVANQGFPPLKLKLRELED